MPQISVIVPVYNVEPYLRRCVDSILAQTFTDFELILVDDGSPDNCGVICDEYARIDSRVKVIHQENRGVSAARNAGLDAAKGYYICFCDSDDYLPVTFFQNGIDICTREKSDICLFGYERVSREGIDSKYILNHDISKSSIELSEYDFLELINRCFLFSSCSKLISSDLIGDNRFDTSLSFGEDRCFIFSLLRKTANVYASSLVGYYYWCNSASATSMINISKCESVINTYLFLYIFSRDRGYGQQSLFCKCIDNWWLNDYLGMINQILYSTYSTASRIKMVRILRSNTFLNVVVQKQMSVFTLLRHHIKLICIANPVGKDLWLRASHIYRLIRRRNV